MALRYGEAARDDAAIKTDGPGAGELCKGSPSGAGTADPLDVAYAARLHALVLAYPQDADILSLWAEAVLVATREDWWDEATGKPAPRIGELTQRLEQLSAVQPDHTGLNHYLIHAADAAPAAQRALPAAERLAALAPNSPHLVHMPSHIYVRVGRYADAAQANQAAVQADVDIAQAQKDQGFAVSKDWRGHNTHFLWYSLLMQGRGDAALDAARTMAQRAENFDHAMGEYFRSLPLLTLLRLERWDAVLAEPQPKGERGMAAALGQLARGVALARQGRASDARAALVSAQAGAALVVKGFVPDRGMDPAPRDMADSAVARLQAEIALAEQRGDEALAQHARAVASSKEPDGREPPRLAGGARLALAEAQLALGRAADAEATLRADLVLQPDSGWALQSLVRALDAQGKSAQAAETRQRLERVWAQADAPLKQRRS